MATLSQIEAIHIPNEEHPQLVEAARNGDHEAADRLFRGFAGYLQSLIGSRYAQTVDRDEAESVVALAFMEAVQDFDTTHERASFVGLVHQYAERQLTAAGHLLGGRESNTVRVSVPERTLKRFFSILKKADGDPEIGAQIAPNYSMSRETFTDIARMRRDMPLMYDESPDEGTRDVFNLESERLVDTAPGTPEIVEESLLLDAAWSAVDDFETDVCRLYYGFSDYRENSDAEIGDKLGFTRSKIQRTRVGALDKMRGALGLNA